MILHSMIVLEEQKNGRSYMFQVPQGSSYDEGKEVLSAMIEHIESMKQEAIKKAEEVKPSTQEPEAQEANIPEPEAQESDIPVSE